jgi:hypothetical protein
VRNFKSGAVIWAAGDDFLAAVLVSLDRESGHVRTIIMSCLCSIDPNDWEIVMISQIVHYTIVVARSALNQASDISIFPLSSSTSLRDMRITRRQCYTDLLEYYRP